jgi:hypothetical protein
MVMLKHKYEDQLGHGKRSQSERSFKLSCHVLAFALVACSLGSSMLLPAFASPTGNALASSREDTTKKSNPFDLAAGEFKQVEALRKAKFGNWKPLTDKKQINIVIVDSFSATIQSKIDRQKGFSGIPNPLNYRVDGVVSKAVITDGTPNIVVTQSDTRSIGTYLTGVQDTLLTLADKPDAMYFRYGATERLISLDEFEKAKKIAAEGGELTYEFGDAKALVEVAEQVNGPVFVEAGNYSGSKVSSLALASFWAPNVIVVGSNASDGTTSERADFSPQLFVRGDVSPQKLWYENGIPRGVGIQEFGMIVDFSQILAGYTKVSGSLLSDSLASDSEFKLLVRFLDHYGGDLPKQLTGLDSRVFSAKQVKQFADHWRKDFVARYPNSDDCIHCGLYQLGEAMEDRELYIDARTLYSLIYGEIDSSVDGFYRQVNGRLLFNVSSSEPIKTESESFAGAFAFRAFIQSYLQEEGVSRH